MVKVESFCQYSHLIKEFQRRYGKSDTNCFFLAKEIDEYIGKEKISYAESVGGLYFFVKEEEYIRLYFFLEKSALPENIIHEKICILDFVYRNERKPANLQELLNKWRTVGYMDYHLYQRMALRKADLNENYRGINLSEEKFTFQMGDLNLANDILELWKTGLDERSTPLPDKMELIAKITRGEVFCITSDTGELCAAIQFLFNGATCLLQHLAVSETFKRKGLGKSLFTYAIDTAFEKGAKVCNLWVDVENTPAINLYRKCGYKEDGMVSKQFIYKMNEEKEIYNER